MLLEICAASVEDCRTAESGGAGRVELNAAIPLGGLTPSLAVLQEVKHSVSVPVIALARPRAGGFCYSDMEFAILCREIELLLDAGADGIATGVLTSERNLDSQRMRKICELIRPREIVFHRAFDVLLDWSTAVEQLIDLGADRILTSGQHPTAIGGADVIRQIIDQSAGRIEVLPASGIRPENVDQLIETTGCRQVHASLAKPIEDPSIPRNSRVKFSQIPDCETGSYLGTDANMVSAMMKKLRGR